MRTGTAGIVFSFQSGHRLTCGNTFTDGRTIWLHDNLIVRKVEGGIEITDAGWKTRTTCERLNALPGVVVTIKNKKLVLNGEAWDGSWKFIPDVEKEFPAGEFAPEVRES